MVETFSEIDLFCMTLPAGTMSNSDHSDTFTTFKAGSLSGRYKIRSQLSQKTKVKGSSGTYHQSPTHSAALCTKCQGEWHTFPANLGSCGCSDVGISKVASSHLLHSFPSNKDVGTRPKDSGPHPEAYWGNGPYGVGSVMVKSAWNREL